MSRLERKLPTLGFSEIYGILLETFVIVEGYSNGNDTHPTVKCSSASEIIALDNNSDGSDEES